MTRIVTSTYRYKRPPGKRKAVALEVPAVVKAADPAKARKRSSVSWRHDTSDDAKAATLLLTGRIVRRVEPVDSSVASSSPTEKVSRALTLPANDDRKSAIVTIRRKPARILPPGLLPETPEEHKRRGDGAGAMFQEMKRQIAAAAKKQS